MKKVIPEKAILVPDNASRVFRGKIFDVYQWPQKMFDDSIETFEMLKRPDTVEFIVIKDGKLILIEEAQPGRAKRIRIPGGRVDEGEDWLTVAKRECFEELGMVFRNWRLIFVTQPAAKVEWFGALYLATDLESQEQPKTDAGEQIKIMPFDFLTVKQLVSSANDPIVSYLMPIFNKVISLEELLNIPDFTGQEVDR